jgi:hypothetical protein
MTMMTQVPKQPHLHLTRRQKAELARFEACREQELATFRPETLDLYRRLMLEYASSFGAGGLNSTFAISGPIRSAPRLRPPDL